jgi:hypothetical protein
MAGIGHENLAGGLEESPFWPIILDRQINDKFMRQIK